MKIEDVKGEYFKWLCDTVKIDSGDHSYFILAKTLHSMDFYEIVKNDSNRESDGYELREDFCYDISRDNNLVYSIYLDELNGPCSVFEMLIALALRIDADIMEYEEYNPVYWFWKMIENLGIDDYNDEDFYDLDGNYWVSRAVTIFVNRKYKSNGDGGLFPLHNPQEDQRDVEIWYQMNAYIMENYE